MASEAVTLEGVSRKYSCRLALDHICLEVRQGEILVVMGKSGAGKSTLLRLIAGLEPADTGRILLAGQDATHLPPHRRGVAMVRQRAALFPDRTVARQLRNSASNARLIERLQLAELLPRRCETLSGGEQQRVSLAQALGSQPVVCLLDEPAASLDTPQRESIQNWIREIQREFSTTLLYVTHDPIEAQRVADRVAVLDGGKLIQVGTPAEVYAEPANSLVADLFSVPKLNWLRGTVTQTEDQSWLALGNQRWQIPPGVWPQGDVRLGVRPQAVEIVTNDGKTTNIAGHVADVRRVGSDWILQIKTQDLGADNPEIISCSRAAHVPQAGETIRITFSPDRLLGFCPATGRALSKLTGEKIHSGTI